MTKGTFLDALSRIDERFINESLEAGSDAQKPARSTLKRAAAVFACAAALIAVTIGVYQLISASKGNAGLFGIEKTKNSTRANFTIAITMDKNVYDIDERIPVTIYAGIGEGDVAAGVEFITISSESSTMRLDEEDPIVLKAADGDFNGSDLELDGSVRYKRNRTAADLPYKTTVYLKLNAGGAEPCGVVEIEAKLSGVGFDCWNTLTLYYYQNDGLIAFSTVSVEDARGML